LNIFHSEFEIKFLMFWHS